MDFFKPGSLSIKMITPDGQVIDLGDAPDFLTNSQGETESSCDCSPGMCLGESETFEGPTADLFNMLFGAGPADDGDDDFEVEDEGVHPADRLEAVAQLGRITETLANLANLHGRLVSDLLEG